MRAGTECFSFTTQFLLKNPWATLLSRVYLSLAMVQEKSHVSVTTNTPTFSIPLKKNSETQSSCRKSERPCSVQIFFFEQTENLLYSTHKAGGCEWSTCLWWTTPNFSNTYSQHFHVSERISMEDFSFYVQKDTRLEPPEDKTIPRKKKRKKEKEFCGHFWWSFLEFLTRWVPSQVFSFGTRWPTFESDLFFLIWGKITLKVLFPATQNQQRCFHHVMKNGAMPLSREPDRCTQVRYASVINSVNITDD